MAAAKASQAVRSARAIASQIIPQWLQLEVDYEQAFDEWQSLCLMLEERVNAGEILFSEDVLRLVELRARVNEAAEKLNSKKKK